METRRKRLGILVGGGPAPGINSAISATVIEAVNENLEVIGIYDGYEHLMQGRTDMVRPLTIEEVSRIHFQGGSILRTARANPTRHPDDMQRTMNALQALGISALATIGGDDTAFAAFEVARAANGAIRVAHIPKTIDNDLPLPGGVSTFGFETARHVGTQLVRNLMEDARTTNRWIFVVVMGRKAGHLALGIGKAAGATLTIIPEEFPQERICLNDISRMLEAAILKRRVMGSEHGVAVIAEGLSEKLAPEELANMPGVEMVYDPYGHIRLGEIPLTTILKRQVQEHFAARHDEHSIVDVTLGYELRCAQAIPFDVDYTRTLGYGAVRFLLSEPADGRLRHAGFLCLEGGHLNVLPLDELRDPATGRIRVRVVDVRSEHYHVARKYMIRLEQSDLDDVEMCAKLAAAAHMTPEQFVGAFGAAVTAPEGWTP
ncbi:MAG TPA: diphosphate--fructose-6-phosphate 1-phosphotransferase [Candidatus Tectomicrobia bacterium]|nr:diphosphate--fructose-6-phosphate 1-phosphotransferase [Candidatus Tectomicrobia bacterium]